MTNSEMILQSWKGKRLNTPQGTFAPYLLARYFDDFFIEGMDDDGKRYRIRVSWKVVDDLYHFGHATWDDGERVNYYTLEERV